MENDRKDDLKDMAMAGGIGMFGCVGSLLGLAAFFYICGKTLLWIIASLHDIFK